MSLQMIRAIGTACGLRVELLARWRGGELDRLLAGSHEAVSRWLAGFAGWEFAPEVSYSIGGERGVVDVLGWHPETRSLLVLELKTQVIDVGDLMSAMDRRRRLATRMAIERGWLGGDTVRGLGGGKRGSAVDGSGAGSGTRPTVSVWVLVAEGSTNRRRVRAHESVLRRAFPEDRQRLAEWLRDPLAPAQGADGHHAGATGAARARSGLSGLSFFPYAHGVNARRNREAVHAVRAPRGETR